MSVTYSPLIHPTPAVDMWMETTDLELDQKLGGASSSFTMQEAEEEDSDGDTEEGGVCQDHVWFKYQTASIS